MRHLISIFHLFPWSVCILIGVPLYTVYYYCVPALSVVNSMLPGAVSEKLNLMNLTVIVTSVGAEFLQVNKIM